ncbi:MAG: protein kinase [Anaerolineae bacterium]
MSDEIRTNVILMGRYQVQGELGRGGMGSVYLAYDLQHRRPVAIKVARLAGADARAQFRKEALYLQRLHHHNLPRVLDTFSDDQRDFLVMEYIPGDDLESLVQRQGSQPEWLVLRWADELLDVLDYLHMQDPPIIHRDVKPGNLKLRQNDTLVLVDFGIAKEYRPEGGPARGINAVSPGFSPPEQYSEAPTDERTDVYAAGATLYYLLTGQAPAPAPDREAGVATVAPVAKLAPKTSQATDRLVMQALHLASGERWGNAAEMRRTAQVASRKLITTGPLPPVPELPANLPKASTSQLLPAQSGKRRTGLALASALLGVALLAVAALLWVVSSRANDDVLPAPTAIATLAADTPVSVLAAPAASPMGVATVVTLLPTAITSALATPAAEAAPPTSTPLPTSTPITPADTPTAPPVDTATPMPTATLSPASTPTQAAVVPTATPNPTATPKPPTATPAPPPAAIRVGLTGPASGSAGRGTQTFSWQANQSPSANQAFEFVFWKQGQDPMRDAFGPVGTVQAANGQVAVNLESIDGTLGPLFDPGEYLWGVLLVETAPYRRIGLVSDAWSFRYETGGGGPQPTATSGPNPG